MSEAVHFTTKRLKIRPYKLEDQEAVHTVINHPGIYAMTINIPYPYPKDQVATWLHFTLKNAAYKRGFEWGIFDKQGYYLGNIGLVNINWQHHHGEITYFIRQESWGQGYATEAVEAILGYGFSHLQLERIQGRFMAENKASKRVLEKCGFVYEGLARHAVVKEQDYKDIVYCALLKEGYLEKMSKS